MRIHIGSDHAGFVLKEDVVEHLEGLGHEVTDVGAFTDESVDYPDYAREVAAAVATGEADVGVLVCGTGIGMAMVANKVAGVRAVQASTPEFARMARSHNDANVLTLAGRHSSTEEAFEIVDAFLGAAFEGGRHRRRVDKIRDIER